jgi:hypothetical protein
MSAKQTRKTDNPNSSLGSRTPIELKFGVYNFNQAIMASKVV